MQKSNLPWLSSEDSIVPNTMEPQQPGTSVAPPPQIQRTHRKYVSGSLRSRSFDGRLDLETLPEVQDEEAEELKVEEEERRRAAIRLNGNREGERGREEKKRRESIGDSTQQDTSSIRRPSNGTVRSLARHLSEKQKERSTVTKARHRFSMPDLQSHPKWQSPSVSESSVNVSHESTPPRSTTGMITRQPSQFYAGGSIRSIPPGTLMLYDPRHLAYPTHTDYPPVWYPMPPPPPPMFVPLGPPLMHAHPNKGMMSPPPSSSCRSLCCAGVAQLLWTVISIILIGIIAALLLTLFVV